MTALSQARNAVKKIPLLKNRTQHAFGLSVILWDKKSLLRVMLSCLAMIDILPTGILYSLYYLMILVIGNAVIWVMPGTFFLNSASKFS